MRERIDADAVDAERRLDAARAHAIDVLHDARAAEHERVRLVPDRVAHVVLEQRHAHAAERRLVLDAEIDRIRDLGFEVRIVDDDLRRGDRAEEQLRDGREAHAAAGAQAHLPFVVGPERRATLSATTRARCATRYALRLDAASELEAVAGLPVLVAHAERQRPSAPPAPRHPAHRAPAGSSRRARPGRARRHGCASRPCSRRPDFRVDSRCGDSRTRACARRRSNRRRSARTRPAPRRSASPCRRARSSCRTAAARRSDRELFAWSVESSRMSILGEHSRSIPARVARRAQRRAPLHDAVRRACSARTQLRERRTRCRRRSTRPAHTSLPGRIAHERAVLVLGVVAPLARRSLPLRASRSARSRRAASTGSARCDRSRRHWRRTPHAVCRADRCRR